MNSRIAILSTLFLFILPYQLHAAQDIQGKVMKVKDGDTVVIAPVNIEQFITCRLYGIDSPETAKKGEPGQPYGDEATNQLKHLILAKTVHVVTVEKDRYNRDICFITLDGSGREPRNGQEGICLGLSEIFEAALCREVCCC